MIRESTEAIVVGAGAGGGCAAKVLASAGIKTILLERGEWTKADVFGEDDLSSQRTPILVQGPGRGGARTRKCHFAITEITELLIRSMPRVSGLVQ